MLVVMFILVLTIICAAEVNCKVVSDVYNITMQVQHFKVLYNTSKAGICIVNNTSIHC